MVREQEMLLEELADFVIMLGLNPAAAGGPGSPVIAADGLQATAQQQQHQGPSDVSAVVQSMRGWTVANMTDNVFPVSCCLVQIAS